MAGRWIRLGCLAMAIMLVVGGLAFSLHTYDRSAIVLKTPSGVATTEFQLYETILFSASDLEPSQGYAVRIIREDGEVIGESSLSADEAGRIPETVIWYEIGLPAYEEIPVNIAAIGQLSQYAGMEYVVEILLDDSVIRELPFGVHEDDCRPMLYATDAWGNPKSGFLAGEGDVWVVGRHFPEGSIVRLWAVPAQGEWNVEDELADATNQYHGVLPPIFELGPGQNGFKRLLWPKELGELGSYDIVAEVITYPFGRYRPQATAQAQTFVAHTSISGFVVQRQQLQDEPLDMNLAGTSHSPLTYQETFLTSESVYVGIDPLIQPTYKTQSADVYVVKHRTKSEWQSNTALIDVTGFVETIKIQFVCSNWWKTLVWTAPLKVGEYDVVLDFNQNGHYDSGTDLIDALDPVGFTVAEVRVDKISFNYTGAGAIAIDDKAGGGIITAPEYSASATGDIREAAWVRGGTHTVKVEFKAVPGVTSVRIWAESGLGGLASSGSPVTVSLPGGSGSAEFTVNQVPNKVGKHEFFWDWKYRTSGTTHPMGLTGKHIVYTVLGTPTGYMTTPWLEILDYACDWAGGAMTKTAVCTNILSNGFAKHYDWVGNCHVLASSYVRLLNTQGIAASQHRWGKKTIYPLTLDDMVYPQITKSIDPVGPSDGYGPQNWNFHQWAEAEGSQRDPAAGVSFAGTWGDYEDDLYVQYTRVTGVAPLTTGVVANQPGQSVGCEAPAHRHCPIPAPDFGWLKPDF